jgi:hypothetical protein
MLALCASKSCGRPGRYNHGHSMADVKAFISYRRSDSQAATGRLYDRLNAAYPGRFFRDVSGIGVGVDFLKEIERAVGSSVALLAVIGPTWASAEEAGQKRLADPEDFVRISASSPCS